MHDIPMTRSPRSPRELVAAILETAGPASLLGALARPVAAVARELRIHRAVRDLAAMDERMLKDIGLTRAEIRGAVRFGRDR